MRSSASGAERRCPLMAADLAAKVAGGNGGRIWTVVVRFVIVA